MTTTVEKKRPNRIFGRYLIEHNPEEENPFAVWDLMVIFASEYQSFSCRTEAEAEGLCDRLAKVAR